MDLSKAYVEYYAKLHVDAVMRLNPLCLQKSERPDFVSRRREIGLEVTRAVIEEWAQQEADMNRQFGADLPGEAVERTMLADCENGDFEKKEQEDGFSVLLELPQNVRDLHTARIIERIEDKTQSLKEYQRCNTNWLYVYSETLGLKEEDVARLQAHVDAQRGEMLFDTVFVKVGCKLYLLRKNEETQFKTLGWRQSYRTLRRARAIALWVSRKEGKSGR